MTADRAVLREQIARALALVDDYDGCFERIDEWNALEQWERDAQPQEEPTSDYEDAEWWRRRADAVMPLVSDALAAVEAERDSTFDQFAERVLDGPWGQRVEKAEAERDAARAVIDRAWEVVRQPQESRETALLELHDLTAPYRKAHPDA